MERSNDDRGAAERAETGATGQTGEAGAADEPVRDSWVGGSSSDEEIRRRAYELYQARGGTSGYEMDDWLTAEREVRERGAGPAPGERRDESRQAGGMSGAAGAGGAAGEGRAAMGDPGAGEERGATPRRAPRARQGKTERGR